MRSTLLLSILLFTAFTAAAQRWHPSPANNGRDINAIKIFHPDTVVTAGGWKLVNQDTSSALFYTFNGGLYLWNVADFPGSNNWITSVDFTDAMNGIAVGNDGFVVKTSDGGRIWTAAPSVPLNRDLNKIYLLDAQNFIVVGGTQDSVNPRQTIYKSTNGGQTWNVVLDQAGHWLKSVYFPTATTGYAVGDSGAILKTTNGGDNWNAITAPIQRNFNAIWFTDADNGFIVGGYPKNDSIQTILQTTNGGNTWTIKRDAVDDMLRDVHFSDAANGYAVGDDATVLQTTDGGQTWNPVTIPGTLGDEQFNAVRFYDTTFGYVSGKWGAQYIYNTEQLPEILTSSAELVDSQVTLHAYLNTHGELAAHKFVFSDMPDFSSNSFETAYYPVVRTNTLTHVQEAFHPALFTPGVPSYYFAAAFTKAGMVYGDTLSFFNGTSNASIKTLPANNITDSSATLYGTVRGYPGSMQLFFEYGTTPALGTAVAATPAVVNDTALRPLTATLTGLQPRTVYYYRVKGIIGGNTYIANTQMFFSGPGVFYSALQALPATDVLDSSATLNGFASGFKVPATLTFEYSAYNPMFVEQAQPVFSIGDSAVYQPTVSITALTPNTLYYFRIKAETIFGTYYSDTLSFYTFTENPNMHARTATQVTTGSAKLNGRIRYSAEPLSSITFEYGATLSLGSSINATPYSISDTLAHDVWALVMGLQDGTLYYYRLKAVTNSGAVLYSAMRQVYTGEPTIPNWDFQTWNTETATLLDDWILIGDAHGRVAGHSGSYALQMGSPSIATLGLFGEFTQNGIEFAKYVPFNFRADSLVAWMKYDIRPGDTLPMFVNLKQGSTRIASQQCKIAGSTGGVFQRMAFPIAYTSPGTPDSIGIFMACGLENSFAIDDLGFAPAGAPALPNHNFESWTDYPFLNLADWKYIKNVIAKPISTDLLNPVSRTYFSAPNDYAAELNVLGVNGIPLLPGELSTAWGILGSPPPSFPVYAQHKTMNGFFQYYPANGDTMRAEVMLFSHGVHIGSGTFRCGDTVDAFTIFEAPITYTGTDSSGGFIPDSAIVAVRSSQDIPLGLSRLIVDKLSFDGVRGDTQTVSVPPLLFAQQNITLYPNPTTSTITIQLETAPRKAVQLEIYGMDGKRVYTALLKDKRTEVPVHDLRSGIYFVQVNGMVGRFVVVK